MSEHFYDRPKEGTYTDLALASMERLVERQCPGCQGEFIGTRIAKWCPACAPAAKARITVRASAKRRKRRGIVPMKNIQPDPFLRDHPERDLPAVKAPHDGVDVINARQETKQLRKLAEDAGVDPKLLAMLKEV